MPEAAETVPEPGLFLRIIKDRRIAFMIVGGMNTVLGTLWFIGYQLVFEALHVGRFDYILSLVCAQITSVFTSFLSQRYLVFRVRGRFWGDLARFALVSTSAFGANLVLLPLCVELLGLPKIPAQLAVTAVIAISSYLAHRDFSFRRKSPNDMKQHDATPPQRSEGEAAR
ncbi:GtrA family protein [Leucobacter ruminantium]|uniref:GtrA family protein n=1 Tax=Leucobacter ruminantium TaxID=1289170 RepID=A0A939M1Y1_9MICO|nr:GtrA family protein [Leucobacter ruminantium]MBO1805545.1 GtrA family protein [Leucobacter ruminantium]